MEPVSLLVGFGAGFISGISYRERHEQPYQDLKKTVEGLGLFIRRTVMGGPKAPGETPEEPEEKAA